MNIKNILTSVVVASAIASGQNATAANICGASASTAPGNLSGSCNLIVRNANLDEIRTRVDLDFTQIVLARKTIATLPSGETLVFIASRISGASSELRISAEVIGVDGAGVFELSSQGDGKPLPGSGVFHHSLTYENYRDTSFVLIFAGCSWG